MMRGCSRSLTAKAAENELLEDETARVEARAEREAKEKVDAHPEIVSPICEDARDLGEEAAFENFKTEYTTDRAPPIRYVFDEALSRCELLQRPGLLLDQVVERDR